MELDKRLDKCIRYSTLQRLIEENKDPKEDNTLTDDCPDCVGYNTGCPEYVPFRSVGFFEEEKKSD